MKKGRLEGFDTINNKVDQLNIEAAKKFKSLCANVTLIEDARWDDVRANLLVREARDLSQNIEDENTAKIVISSDSITQTI